MAREIQAVQVTQEAFSQYGRLTFSSPTHEPVIEDGRFKVWPNVVDYPAEPRSVIVLEAKRRPMRLTQMERHARTEELFIVADGECVACFAEAKKPDETPGMNGIVAFKMSDVAAYTVDRGVWHWVGFPIGRRSLQFVNFRTGTPEEDVDIKDLPQLVTIVY